MTYHECKAKFKEIDESVKKDPKMIINTLLYYFGGADSLWFAVHEHITEFNDMEVLHKEGYEDVFSLEDAYRKAVDEVVEQEFLVNDDN